MKKANALDMAIAHLPGPRRLGWWQRIDPKDQPTLDELEAAWRAGKLGPFLRPAAHAIAKTLTELGIATVQVQGVQHWLKRKT